MHRVMGLVLAALGALLIVGAVLVRTVVSGQVVKYPLSEHLTSELRGTGVSYFSPTLIRPETGATIRVTSTVAGDPSAGDSSTAVWDTATSLFDVTHGQPVQGARERRVQRVQLTVDFDTQGLEGPLGGIPAGAPGRGRNGIPDDTGQLAGGVRADRSRGGQHGPRR